MKGKNKKKKVIITTCILLIITALVSYLFIPLFSSLKFGLDLQGGFEILYKAESIDGSKMTQDKLTATYKTLSKRIDSLGVSEPEIVLEGNNRIRVKCHNAQFDICPNSKSHFNSDLRKETYIIKMWWWNDKTSCRNVKAYRTARIRQLRTK